MAMPARPQLRRDLVRLTQRGLGVRDFSLSATRLLAGKVPFDGVCMLTMDPATLLPTGEVVENGLPPAATARMTDIEMGGADVNSFCALATAKQHTATLSRSTRGDLQRSLRHREIRAPHGFGDELRAMLFDETTPWGALTLLRAADQRTFTPAEAALIDSASGLLAEGLRRAVLLDGLPKASANHDDSAGLVVLASDYTIIATDAVADRWLAELRSRGAAQDRLPTPLRAVAGTARHSADGSSAEPALARARVLSASGQWLLVRGTMLGTGPDAQTAVLIEPARSHELAPLAAAAHGLTVRERAVSQLVARGYPTTVIAEQLHLSAWTVQDYLKSIFDKVGVGSRGELVARLFFGDGGPRLTD